MLHLVWGAVHFVSIELTHVIFLVSSPHWALTILIVVLLLISNISHAIIFLFLLLMMHLLHELMLLLLMMINRRKLAHSRSLGTQHFVLLFKLLDLTLQLAYLDVLQFQLSLNLAYWLFLATHLHVMTLVRALSRVVISSSLPAKKLYKAQFFV